MAKKKSLLPVTLSVLYATLLLCVLAVAEISGLSNWSHLAASEKRWIIFTSTYAIVLTASGFLYAAMEWRAAGIIHAGLMLGIAGLVLYEVASGLLASPGPDNAAAGILAAANVVFLVAGALAAICGIAVIRRIFPGKESPDKLQ